MEKKSLLKYILVAVLGCVAFVVAWSFINPLLHPEKAFADGISSVFYWFLGVVFGTSSAYSLWKKDTKGSEKKEK